MLGALSMLSCLATQAAAGPAPVFSFLPPSGAAGSWTLTASPYISAVESQTPGADTNADTDMLGGTAGLTYHYSDTGSVSLRLNAGLTETRFLERIQTLDTSSVGFGVQVDQQVGPATIGVGGSYARSWFDVQLLADASDWDGWEAEGHFSVSVPIQPTDRLGIEFTSGFRALRLTQDEHLLGAAIIPRESRDSRLAFAAASAQMEFTAGAQTLAPWLFVGWTHDFKAQPPQGPSIFLTGLMAGNSFTLFPNDTSGVPGVFPDRNTVFGGAGLALQISDTASFGFGYLAQRNGAFFSNSFKAGLNVAF